MKKNKFISLLLACSIGFVGFLMKEETNSVSSFFGSFLTEGVDELLGDLSFDGNHQEIIIQNNQPDFSSEDLSLENGVWQSFSELDRLNRVGTANVLIGRESFPTEEREPLNVKPTGWKQKKLSNGDWLYNRCHRAIRFLISI